MGEVKKAGLYRGTPAASAKGRGQQEWCRNQFSVGRWTESITRTWNGTLADSSLSPNSSSIAVTSAPELSDAGGKAPGAVPGGGVPGGVTSFSVGVQVSVNVYLPVRPV